MTFNPMMGKAVMKIRQHLEGKDLSVIELGSQTLTFQLKDRTFKDVPDYYDFLGFSKYQSVDFDGRGTVKADLNEPLALGDTLGVYEDHYDLVTNNGTGEHLFDQAQVFRTCHRLCKPKGVILHVLPWVNWRNHGFYNFNPVLFFDLAQANNYEILAMYAGDRDGNVIVETLDPKEIKKPEPTDKNIMLVCALRKTDGQGFRYPVQGKYRHHAASDVGAKPVEPLRHHAGLRLKSVLGALVERRDRVQPFPYIAGRLDPAYLEQIEKNFPDPQDVILGRAARPNALYQRSAAEVLGDESTSPFWREFFELHTGERFLNELFLLFVDQIRARYPQLEALPLKAGVRNRDKAPFRLDCQFAVNTPPEETSSVRGPHVDDPKELYAGLVYLGGGALDIYRWKKDRAFTGRPGMVKKAEAEPEAVEIIETVECLPGTVLFFLNGPDSVHGVAPRMKGDGYRKYLNIIGEVDSPLFELK